MAFGSNDEKFTLKDIAALVAQMNENNQQTVKTLVEEMRKPTPEQVEKKAKEDAEARKRQEMRLAQAKRTEAVEKQGQANCRHVKKDGMPSFGGQVNADGYVRPMCTQCFKVFPKIKAPDEWVRLGCNFQDKDVFPAGSLTEELLLKWHKLTVPEAVVA